MVIGDMSMIRHPHLIIDPAQDAREYLHLKDIMLA